MRTKLWISAALASAAVPPAAYAAPTITVTPTLAPNSFGSPSYTGWVNNSVYAQQFGFTLFGPANQPTTYKAQSTVTASQGIVTGFNSWMGKANPGSAFGSQYANELGNRMLFGIYAVCDVQCSISQLSFTAMSSDAINALGFSNVAGAYNYSSDYRGILKGADGKLGTPDDVYITSGANTQLVDAIVGRGSGSSLAAYCDNCTIAQQQQAINDAAAYWEAFGPTSTFKGTYSLGSSTGSGTFNILAANPMAAAVPEPATWAMMIVGFGAVGYAMRRRSARVAVSYA